MFSDEKPVGENNITNLGFQLKKMSLTSSYPFKWSKYEKKTLKSPFVYCKKDLEICEPQ